MGAQSKLIITIDGPAGAGKTTVSKLLAERLDYRYLDTGALYRGVAWAVDAAGAAADDDNAIGKVCQALALDFVDNRLHANGLDISGSIRTPQITMLASAVSARPVVRQALLAMQRQLGEGGGLVAEGRDMGTVVFPAAECKFFLDATARQRAIRRYEQYGDAATQSVDEIEKEIRQRDANDAGRDIAPLKAAEDAHVIDSTSMSAEAVVAQMMEKIEEVLSRKD